MRAGPKRQFWRRCTIRARRPRPGGGGAVTGPRAAISQPLGAHLAEPVPPLAEHGPADPPAAARRGDAVRHLLGMAKRH